MNEILFFVLGFCFVIVQSGKQKLRLKEIRDPKFDQVLYNSVYVYNGESYAELALDSDRYLHMETLRKHCGNSVQGLSTRDFHIIDPDKNGKLLPENSWQPFICYQCRLPSLDSKTTIPTIPPEFIAMFQGISQSDGATLPVQQLEIIMKLSLFVQERNIAPEIKDLKGEIKDLKGEIKDLKMKKEVDLAKIHELQAQTHINQMLSALFNLGEAAAQLIGPKDRETPAPLAPDTEIKDVKDLTMYLYSRRNYDAHRFKKIKNDPKPEEAIKREIVKIIRAYRYLVCVGLQKIARQNLRWKVLLAIMKNGRDFRNNSPSALNILERIRELCLRPTLTFKNEDYDYDGMNLTASYQQYMNMDYSNSGTV